MVRFASYKTKARALTGYRKKTIRKPRGMSRVSKKNTTALVKSVIANNVERKAKVVNMDIGVDIPGAGHNDSGAGIPGLYHRTCLNALGIGQGDKGYERVGNSIKPISVTFRGVITSNPADPVKNFSVLPYEVHLLWYKRRKGYDVNVVNPLDLKLANTPIPLTNTLINSVYPFNRQTYEIKCHRVFRLRPAPAVSSSSATTEIINSQVSNAPYFHRFHINIPVKKEFQFVQNSTNVENDWLSFVAYVINADGDELLQTSGTALQSRAKLSMDQVINYTDA